MSSKTTIIIIRFSLVALFGWFAIMQLLNPSAWVSFLPQWTGYIPVTSELFVRLNGWFELVASVALLFGFWTRIISPLLGVHLLMIAVVAGGAIGVRDAVLGLVTIALAFSPTDDWSLDTWFINQKNLTKV